VASALREVQCIEVVSEESFLYDSSEYHAGTERAQSDLVEYAVEGAIFGDGSLAHMSVRLVDLGECARTLFSKRFAVPPSPLLHWSKVVAAHIAAGIDPITSVFDGSPQRRLRSGVNELLLAAIPLMSSLERRKFEDAGRLIDRALDFEPDNGLVAAWAAFWQV